MKTNLTYSSAFASLEKILVQMESDEIQVDELAEKVRQAKELIAFCENKLRMVEMEIEKAISENSDPSSEQKD